MFSSFIPETELERAFVQSKQWDADLIWRRSLLYLSREQWGVGAGYTLSLALRYSFDGAVKEQAQTLASIAGLLEVLTQTEKHALFRACELVVALMLELPLKTIETTDVLLFVQLLLEIVASCPGGNFVWIDMFRRLSLIYERRVLPIELEELRARCFVTLSKQDLDFLKLQARRSEEDQPLPHAPNEKMSRAFGSMLPRSILEQKEISVTFAVRLPQTVDERRLDLQNQVLSAKRAYGVSSTEVCTALVKLIDFHIEQKEQVSVFRLLDELTALCGEQSVKLNTYQVRAVYAVSSQVSDQAGFLALIEELERAVFLRRSRIVGFDVTAGSALMRLVFLWHASGRLEQGRKFCANVLQQASKQLPEDDFTLQYFRSIRDAVERIRAGSTAILPISLFGRYDHSDEFIASQAVLALHHLHSDRKDQSLLFLNELLNYYVDCIGETSRRAGEMVWLLAATELAWIDDFVPRLIKVSESKARDVYLLMRFIDHLKDLVDVHGASGESIAWLKLALERSSKRNDFSDSTCVSLLVALAKAMETCGQADQRKELLERIDKAKEERVVSGAGQQSQTSRLLIGQDTCTTNFLVSDQMKSIKLVEILLSKDSLAEAEKSWYEAVRCCKSDTVTPDLKAVTKNLIDELIKKNMFEKAALIAHNPQIARLDCDFYKARIASACIKSGDLFAGAAVLLEAFADASVA